MSLHYSTPHPPATRRRPQTIPPTTQVLYALRSDGWRVCHILTDPAQDRALCGRDLPAHITQRTTTTPADTMLCAWCHDHVLARIGGAR